MIAVFNFRAHVKQIRLILFRKDGIIGHSFEWSFFNYVLNWKLSNFSIGAFEPIFCKFRVIESHDHIFLYFNAVHESRHKPNVKISGYYWLKVHRYTLFF